VSTNICGIFYHMIVPKDRHGKACHYGLVKEESVMRIGYMRTNKLLDIHSRNFESLQLK
jgi:hypothetical protein